MMWRLIRTLEAVVAWHDRRHSLKTRDEAFAELVETSLELRDLKRDLEGIPPTVIRFMRDMFSEDFHRSTMVRPSLSLPEQESLLQKYLDLAVRMEVSAEDLLDMDDVQFRTFLVSSAITTELWITEMKSGVSPVDRLPLLMSVSDAAEVVGL